ncbi:hyaluronoglucosaminidase [Ancylostoma ceylanicum]|uniref:Hyaluronidase n=1 Tax=Ancylostoma ceylanicum TaxID=53326 RepID=A0A0D6LMP0_9BILA|nr:hyaluronoglucosaminidase [Ancylostoma ceylanicum]
MCSGQLVGDLSERNTWYRRYFAGAFFPNSLALVGAVEKKWMSGEFAMVPTFMRRHNTLEMASTCLSDTADAASPSSTNINEGDDVFQNESIEFARTKNSSISDPDKLKKLAEQDYNEAARDFFVKTIKLARDLRPYAKWGFYGFPYCNYDAGSKGEYECKDDYQKWNDRMMFIFNESKALYPSIYLGFNATSDRRFRYVQAILKEARRISEKFSPPLPIYAYTKIEYDPLKELNDFYNDSDLCTTLKQPADLGIDGVVLWSSSANMKDRCLNIKTIMDAKIGPCPGDYKVDLNKYDCKCDIGYSGSNCSSATINSSI